MKDIMATEILSKRLEIRSDVHWRIFKALSIDLGFVKGHPSSSYVSDLSDTDISTLIHRVLRSRSLVHLDDLIKACDVQSTLSHLDSKKCEASYFFAVQQIASFLKKFPFSSNGALTKKTAIEKFFKAEETCRLFNNENHRALLALSDKHPDFLGVVEEIQLDIIRLLGEEPNLGSVYYYAKHGPGVANSELYTDGKTTSFFKWSQLPYSCTAGAYEYAVTAISQDSRWIGALDDWYRRTRRISFTAPIKPADFWQAVIKIENSSKITTVPKTYLTDRTIAIEPLLNVFLQLGVDQVIRRRLRSRWKIDLDSQELNQKLAEQGSVTDSLVTIDLSAASDTVSLKICELLLPPLWFNLLLDLRCEVGVLDKGDPIVFEKVSSMGNGYTFAIESVIFGALVRCAMRRSRTTGTYAVYGDDLIVPTTAYPYLSQLLALAGFKINEDKSFVSGPFRESCGCDYYLGYNVRPVFLKRRIEFVSDALYVHNALYALENSLHWSFGFSFENTRKYIRTLLPGIILERCYGPPSSELDTYLFSQRSLERDGDGQKFMCVIACKPVVYKRRYRDFFFIKLMCSLKGLQPEVVQKWEKRNRVVNSGNSFDIVKRDRVKYVLTRRRVW